MLSDLDKPRFTVAETAILLDEPVATIRSRLQSGTSQIGKGDKDADQGGTRILSMRSVLAIGLQSELSDHGVPLKDALRIARKFTDVAEATADAEIKMGKFRRPGKLAPKGLTYLVAGKIGAAWDGRVFSTGNYENIKITDVRSIKTGSCVLIDCNDFVIKIEDRMKNLE